jgi:glycosyltransferase involved in cell wall biosynthesis
MQDRLSQTEHLLANSTDTAQKVREAFDTAVDEVITPGVDADRLRPGREPAFAAERPVVLYVGRLFEQKGVFDLLEAVAEAAASPAVHLVGYGRDAAVRERSRDLGIADRVVLHGEVPHGDLPQYYAAADVCCLPSHAESFGMANLEAMACGVPVVTSDLPAIREYITDGENGVLAPPGDPEALAGTLEGLLASPARRERIGAAARETATAFTWAEQARRFEEYCASILDREPVAVTDERPRPAPGPISTRAKQD